VSSFEWYTKTNLFWYKIIYKKVSNGLFLLQAVGVLKKFTTSRFPPGDITSSQKRKSAVQLKNYIGPLYW